MDEIKTTIDKIFDQFSDSIIAATPKRLSFNLNESFETLSSSKKRKHSDVSIEENGEKRFKNGSSVCNTSLNSSVVSSPWEARQMRADLLEAKSQITQLKQEVNHQNKVRSEMELLYRSKIDSLQSQLEHSTSKIGDMEKHLSVIRKREIANREEVTKARNECNLNKQNYEEKLYLLKKDNHELVERMRHQQNDMANQIGDLQRKLMEAEQNLKSEQEEYEVINEMCMGLQEKADKFDDMEKELNGERQKAAKLQSQVSEMEYQLASYGEWKNLSKSAQSRLANIADLEKENTRLKQELKNLRDSVGNKLILEEQVHDLKTRLENSDKNNGDVSAIRVHMTTLEMELKQWRAIATDHCGANAPTIPSALRSRIEEILQKDLVLTSEKTNAKCEKKSLQEQYNDIKNQADAYLKNNTDMKIILKRHQSIIHKMQKKLIIVAGERDCYKRLLDNYEKDLTISGAQSQNSPDSQNRIRIDMLERTVNGYKEMCANLEKELQNAKVCPEINIDTINNESYDKLRKELTVLRADNDKIRRRKEELELELEHRCLRGDFNVDKYKVVHLAANPAAEAYEANKNEVERLQIELERLKRKIRKMEENESEMTSRLNETSNVTVNVKEVNQLRTQIQSLESKNQHLKEVYRAASQEFRDVCYMLFGYRVDRVTNTNYRIISMYAETEDEFLSFRINESGVLDMLESDYSISLGDMMKQHLGTHKSLPAFLSTLTLDLFNRVTVIS